MTWLTSKTALLADDALAALSTSSTASSLMTMSSKKSISTTQTSTKKVNHQEPTSTTYDFTNLPFGGSSFSSVSPEQEADQNVAQKRNGAIGIGVGVGVGGVLLIAAIILLICGMQKKKRRMEEPTTQVVVVNNTYAISEAPATPSDTPVINTPLVFSEINDVTYSTVNKTKPVPASINNSSYEEALPVVKNHGQLAARTAYDNVATPVASSSVFTITDNDMYRTNPKKNIAGQGNGLYSLETRVDDTPPSQDNAHVGNEGFTIVENDLYR